MANWCLNKLIIDGPDEDIQRLIDEVWTGEDIFNKILPEPEEYTNEIIDDLMASNTGKKRIAFNASLSNCSEVLEEHIQSVRADIVEKPWYHWRIEHWETKWDLEDEEDYCVFEDGTDILFSTVNSPPVPVIRAMSRQYPTLTICLKYFEPDMYYGGEATFVGGEGQDNYYSDETSHGISYEEFRCIASEFGYQDEEEEEEPVPANVNWQTEGF
ncbi:MAG: hypothetical protein ABSG67_22595 [Thermoguttaceae bacterium]|jgi:hypothetical protein